MPHHPPHAPPGSPVVPGGKSDGEYFAWQALHTSIGVHSGSSAPKGVRPPPRRRRSAWPDHGRQPAAPRPGHQQHQPARGRQMPGPPPRRTKEPDPPRPPSLLPATPADRTIHDQPQCSRIGHESTLTGASGDRRDRNLNLDFSTPARPDLPCEPQLSVHQPCNLQRDRTALETIRLCDEHRKRGSSGSGRLENTAIPCAAVVTEHLVTVRPSTRRTRRHV